MMTAIPTNIPKFAQQNKNKPQPRFGNVYTQVAQNVAHQLPGMERTRISGALKTFDFKELGLATIPQIMVIYGMCIASRIYNSARRSKNELREEVARDSMGFGFWFFGTPMLQRAFLKLCAPEQYKHALLEIKQKPAQGKFVHLSLKDKIRTLNWTFNPLARYSLPSTKQVKEQMEFAIHKMEKSGYARGSEEFNHVEQYYKNMMKWRNFATGLGYIVTIGLLGIGVNLYNIHVTKKKMMQRKMATQPPVASLQPQPAAQPFMQL